MMTWIASHATATIIGGATISTAIAFAIFGFLGAAVVWGIYGVATYGISLAKSRTH